ncbi:MAG: acriflavin resistance protein, partial [Acidimicrobiales bacterium]|nr:acriflavin resistance protein [Acidimicrobiales bacterium]
ALGLGASLLVTLTVAPALAAVLLKLAPRRSSAAEPPTLRAIGRATDAVMARAGRRPIVAVVLALLLAAAGLASGLRLTPGLSPSLRETELVVRLNATPGTALAEMNRIVARVGAELRSVHGVRSVAEDSGRAIASDRVVGSGSAELWVDLDPSAGSLATTRAVERVVAGYPGLTHQVVGYYNDRVAQARNSAAEPVVVRIYGDDPEVLRAKATEVRTLLAGVRGVVHPRVEAQSEQPTIQVEVDLASAERHGLKPGDVRRAASTLVSGLEVGSLYEDQKVFQVVVVGAPAARQSLSSVQDLVIDTPDKSSVRLGDVAKVSIGRSLSVIKHEDVSRSIDVSAGVDGRDVAATVGEVKAVMRGVRFPLGHSAKVLGDYEKQRSAHRDVALAAVVAGVLVFLLLQAALESWWLALIAFAALPLALAGGAVAAWLDGGRLSLGSLIGVFAVGAIAIRGSTYLLAPVPTTTSADEARGAVRRAASERAAPLLIAAVVIAVALVPFVVLGDRPGTEILRPLAIVVLGGLVSSTITTLVLLPIAWLAIERRRRRPEADAGPVPKEAHHAVS